VTQGNLLQDKPAAAATLAETGSSSTVAKAPGASPTGSANAECVAADPVAHVRELGQRAVQSAAHVALADTAQKNQALLAMASAVEAAQDELLTANAKDLAAAKERNISAALLDRLELNAKRLHSMSQGLRDVAAQADPIGALSATERRPSGLQIARMRVPLGVIGVIYESRPNVTADAAGLCIKSGNAVILRGGSEAIHSNRIIARCVRSGLRDAGLPEDAVQLVDTTDRAAVGAMLGLTESIDVIIPRGGKGLVSRISSDAKVPVIKHLDGICHVYIDTGADADTAVAIAVNSKTYRYGICGSMETLLVAESEAPALLPVLAKAFAEYDVELRGCARARDIIPTMHTASDEDWSTEYLAPILSIRVVDNMMQAMDHIAQYGSGHTDAIVTNDLSRSSQFVRQVDSSSVMINAATCFADGAEYGLGAEIGISTDKMHVRGPVGVHGLTTEKYVVTGNGTVRP